jgi:hypothetical protein
MSADDFIAPDSLKPIDSGIEVRPGQPVVPPPHVRAEMEALLNEDGTRLGEVYRLLAEGLDPEQIRVRLGLQNYTFVWGYERWIRALRDGDLPTAPTVALGTARKFRSTLKNPTLSDDARLVLSSNLLVLEQRASDATRREQETEEARQAAATVEAEAVTGVYVYALPHYLRYPYDPDSGRTLLKVGRSGRDVIERFRSQTRTTALPEEPLLLRVYPTPTSDKAAEVERQYHRLLEAADHDRSRARTGGTEWFLTSVRFLDEIASALGLPVRQVVETGDLD